MDVPWHPAILPLCYFSCAWKRSSTEQELPWGTTICERSLQASWQKVHQQGKETSDGAGSLGHIDPLHSASGGVGTVWSKRPIISENTRLKSLWTPHWFVKYWWRHKVICSLCIRSTVLRVNFLHCHLHLWVPRRSLQHGQEDRVTDNRGSSLKDVFIQMNKIVKTQSVMTPSPHINRIMVHQFLNPHLKLLPKSQKVATIDSLAKHSICSLSFHGYR